MGLAVVGSGIQDTSSFQALQFGWDPGGLRDVHVELSLGGQRPQETKGEELEA